MTKHAQNQFNNGLEDAATRHGVFCDTRSEIERYYEGRDLPAKKTAQGVQAYTPPETEQEQPVITLAMKRYFAAGSVTTAWACFFSLCEHGAFTAAASVLGWVVAGGCGLAFVSALFRNCFSWSPAPSAGDSFGGSANAGQNINVVVNVAGQTVTTNTNQK